MVVDGVYTIEAHGVRVAGVQHEGTPLVLVHGGPGDSAYVRESN